MYNVTNDVDKKIAAFLGRKDREYPELNLVGTPDRSIRTFKHSLAAAF